MDKRTMDMIIEAIEKLTDCVKNLRMWITICFGMLIGHIIISAFLGG